MKGPTAQSLVLIFGESKNDSDSVRYLAAAANPRLELAHIRSLPRPTTLQRSANPPAVRRWIGDIEKVVKSIAATGRAVTAVLVHRDADGPDPNGTIRRQLATQLASIVGSHAVVPVEELEAWWFLFPDAVESVRPRAWRGRIGRRHKDVETIRDPKEELVRLTRGARNQPYAESDSVSIARAAYERRLSPTGTSISYNQFCSDVAAIA